MKTVVVGLSGGVDSSVSALLLKKQGFRVIGLHMVNANLAQEEIDANSVKDLCQKLDIEYKIVNYNDEMQLVKDYFLEEYKKGRTPNPCVMCNKNVKFKPFIDFANSIGADYFATGHYARIKHIDGKNILMKAVDKDKDQTYFLNQLTSQQLEKALFPLGELTKPEVRKIAEENNLISAHKKDSFDVCFAGSQKFKDYISEVYPDKSGNIVDINSNKIVGTHTGITKYTIGQRKGLGIGGTKDGVGRWFVVKKDAKTNTIYVSQGNEDCLLSSGLISNNVNWILNKPNSSVFTCNAKFRYRQPDQKVRVEILDDNKVKVYFEEKQRAIAEGQFVVFYDNDTCLGGGVIEETF